MLHPFGSSIDVAIFFLPVPCFLFLHSPCLCCSANEEYYGEFADQTELSDEEYDALMRELKQLGQTRWTRTVQTAQVSPCASNIM